MVTNTTNELSADQLRRRSDPTSIPYDTTDDVPDPTGVVGQPRAVAALEFGVGVQQTGYNIYALGPSGTGKHSIVTRYLEQAARDRPTPPDLCYVHNFVDPSSPRLLSLPAGIGMDLRKAMEKFVDEVRSALVDAFESEEYHERRSAISEVFKEMSAKAIAAVEKQASEQQLGLIKTPLGVTFVPVRQSKPLSDEEIAALPEGEQEHIRSTLEHFGTEMQRVLRQASRWNRERRNKEREMERDFTRLAVQELLDDLTKTFADHESVVAFLKHVREDVIEHAREIADLDDGESKAIAALLQHERTEAPVRRYRVNVLVDQSASTGAPVVYEDNPTYDNLIGRIEHFSQFGTLGTDYSHIKSGALHRAHGGFLVVDAIRLLRSPYAWEGLKRALQAGRLRIEAFGQALGLISTESLAPEPLPLDVRVVILGPPHLYYILCAVDPDFPELFRIAADFDDQIDGDDDGLAGYLELVAMLVRHDQLRAFDRTALARLVEHSRRIAGDRLKLTARMNTITDVLREAHYWAGTHESATVTAEHVQEAIDAREYRADRQRQRSLEHIRRGTLKIATEGAEIGRVNAMTVVLWGEYAFGQPAQITARVRLGSGTVVDIEREVALGGPIHSKGVLILQGFLAEQFAAHYPLSLSASLVFEQTYGGVEGDSASAAELCALLSAIGRVPLSQAFAVTGSVNQHGEVQAVGRVNEKIEGFFDICHERGLDGQQGVIVPHANVEHLMLRADVIEAVRNGQFHVFAVEHINDMLARLTGRDAGTRDDGGDYPSGSVNAAIETRLRHFAERRRAFENPGEEESGNGSGA